MNHSKTYDDVVEAYERMKNNPDLVGAFELTDDGNVEVINWYPFEGYRVSVSHEYIGIDKLTRGMAFPLTHWHPADTEELYSDVCRLGTKGNVTVIHRCFGSESVLYSGPRDECPVSRKWFFGKYFYLRAE